MAENVTNQEQTIRGWIDVNITPDMPLSAIVQFFNVINQRLCAIEDITTVETDGVSKTLTQIYKEQSEAEMKAAKEKQAENNQEAVQA